MVGALKKKRKNECIYSVHKKKSNKIYANRKAFKKHKIVHVKLCVPMRVVVCLCACVRLSVAC